MNFSNQDDSEVDRWFDQVKHEAFLSVERGGYNFVEISSLPNKIDSVSTD